MNRSRSRPRAQDVLTPPSGRQAIEMTLSTPWRAEISRKVLHLCTALIPGIYTFVSRDFMLGALAVCVAFAVAVEFLRHNSSACRVLFRQWLGFMVRSVEWGRLTGATYVLVGALVSVWVFPRHVAIPALLILSVSDTAASLIGLRWGRGQFLGKSFAGSSAFFVTAFAILCITVPDSTGVAFLAALVGTLAEALPALKLGRFEVNDNLLIPWMTGAVVSLLAG